MFKIKDVISEVQQDDKGRDVYCVQPSVAYPLYFKYLDLEKNAFNLLIVRALVKKDLGNTLAQAGRKAVFIKVLPEKEWCREAVCQECGDKPDSKIETEANKLVPKMYQKLQQLRAKEALMGE